MKTNRRKKTARPNTIQLETFLRIPGSFMIVTVEGLPSNIKWRYEINVSKIKYHPIWMDSYMGYKEQTRSGDAKFFYFRSSKYIISLNERPSSWLMVVCDGTIK